MSGEYFPCRTCGQSTHIDDLDAKPERRDVRKYGSIGAAGEAGADFTRLECRACYGPGWHPARSMDEWNKRNRR